MQSENDLHLSRNRIPPAIEAEIDKAYNNYVSRVEKASQKDFAHGQEVCKQSVAVNAKRLKNNTEREGFALMLIEMGAVMLTGCVGIDEAIEESALVLANLKRLHEEA